MAAPKGAIGATKTLDQPGAFSINGLSLLTAAFAEQNHFAKGWTTFETIIGYAAPYALYVHEILTYYHKPPTKAKWLSDGIKDPELQKQLMAYMVKNLQTGKIRESSPKRAMYLGGVFLVRMLRKFVPYDPQGAAKGRPFHLRDSYFIRNVPRTGG